ncbi:ribosome biogenesis protein Nop16 [Podospora appendiculata]|uniref:Nucleolar protein 16 n=1 Tax=Podospora appendiculata TaxID=314037 RepID=A0AAE0X448_9PEZI|nr:ribosome biogenesis protein Nop16 [Podospora appendiculata]
MGRELQKRKRRSSRATVTMPHRRKKALNPMGNDIIAQNWDRKATLSQNYSRFGLVSKLGATAGGPAQAAAPKASKKKDPLAIKSADHGMLRIQEVRVERDAAGKIIRVIRDANPLDDPLNALDDYAATNAMADDGEEWGGIEDKDSHGRQSRPAVICELERQASVPEEKHLRHQSERETEWLQRLIAKHGDDVSAMARDAKLNPMQQTRGDLARRLKKAGLL